MNLEIKNLFVDINNKSILKGFDLNIKPGEIHAIMGPNGTGKSTLSKVIMGNKDYEIKSGTISVGDKVINDLETDEIARLGVFLSMQSPTEITGVSNADFLQAVASKKEGFKLFPFIKEVEKNIISLDLNKDMLYRSVNVGFSGGEKKKNEILQMNILKPKLIILDEIDSGLDVDSLRIVGTKVMEYFDSYKPSILIITHYQRILDYIKPDFVHIMKEGKVLKSGDFTLVKEIEEKGYNNIKTGTSIIEENI